MIPLFFLPAFGVLSSIKTCEQYFQDTIIMFMSGIMVALLIEYSNLHKRIALLTVKIMGGSPRRIHFGLMLVTGFLSMWISNSAATAMMCPILKGVLESLEKQGVSVYEEDEPEDPKDVNEKRPSKLSIAMYLSICYSSSIGGCGTLIGTPTNLAFYGLYEARFGKLNPTETLDFVTFMGYGIPPVILILLLTYFCIEIFYMGLLSKKNKVNQEIKEVCKDKAAAKAVVNASYKALGPMNCHETSALVLFIVLVILFLSKSPKVFPGWGDLINPNIKNSVPTAFIVALSFLLPRTCNYFRFCCGTKAVPRKEIDSLQTWKNLQTHMPWGLIFLVGGGFALAAGSKQSELDKALSSALKGLGILPHPVILFLCIVFAMIATAFTANVAMCNVIIPVLCEMSLAIRCHPLYLVIPVGIACSMAFHLPVSTPPNAIVASFANISTKSMVSCLYTIYFLI